jgi:HEAT repeat protein
VNDLGHRLLELLGAPACVELLAVLELPEAERASAIGALYQTDHGQALAELLIDVEGDPDDVVRLRLVGALRDVLGDT